MAYDASTGLRLSYQSLTGPSKYVLQTTDVATAIFGSTTYLDGTAEQPSSGYGAANLNLARSTRNVGVRKNDLVELYCADGNFLGVVVSVGFNQASSAASSAFVSSAGFTPKVSSVYTT